jgi:hypothetical protein
MELCIHRGHHGIFADVEERVIKGHISDNYLLPARPFTDAAFMKIPTAVFSSHGWTELPSIFQCSAGLISDFKPWNRFSSRRAHMKGQPTVTEDETIQWLTTFCWLL